MNTEAVYMSDTEADQRQYIMQVASLREIMTKPGWKFLKANWHNRREQILTELEKATSEGKWQYYRGQLLGFKKAVGIVEDILEDAKNLQSDLEAEERYGH